MPDLVMSQTLPDWRLSSLENLGGYPFWPRQADFRVLGETCHRPAASTIVMTSSITIVLLRLQPYPFSTVLFLLLSPPPRPLTALYRLMMDKISAAREMINDAFFIDSPSFDYRKSASIVFTPSFAFYGHSISPAWDNICHDEWYFLKIPIKNQVIRKTG